MVCVCACARVLDGACSSDTAEVCPRWLSIPQTARLQSHKQGRISINTRGAFSWCSLLNNCTSDIQQVGLLSQQLHPQSVPVERFAVSTLRTSRL
ncbi:hypothetical protein PGIGA_G00072500 [Pangasianodon gigas]|uniref:Uncharacterized protein n=1 Tax=Pangasianodon gigas TaxID=30993 RepID=A0ACC5X7R6_PANGG|nr:hypothetical protein [Pangasianodon gigas]